MARTWNDDIRKAAKDAGVGMWEIADAMRVSDSSIAMMLRRELSEWDRQCFLRAIREIEMHHRSKTRIQTDSRWDIYA